MCMYAKMPSVYAMVVSDLREDRLWIGHRWTSSSSSAHEQKMLCHKANVIWRRRVGWSHFIWCTFVTNTHRMEWMVIYLCDPNSWELEVSSSRRIWLLSHASLVVPHESKRWGRPEKIRQNRMWKEQHTERYERKSIPNAVVCCWWWWRRW